MTRLVAPAAALVFLVAPAFAQETKTIPQPVSGQTSPWPVSKVIGVAVYNGQNEPIGKIVDLIMDSNARLTTAIISVGQYLNWKDKMVQVPLDLVRFPKDPSSSSVYPQRAALNTTKETLMGMPAFKY